MKKCMVSMATINVILEHGVYLQNHRKILENIGVYKISCNIAVKKLRMLKEVSNECYGVPKVSFKNNLIFNFMNINGTLEIGMKKWKN